MLPYQEFRTGSTQELEAKIGAFIGTLIGSAIAAVAIYAFTVAVFSLERIAG